MCLALENNDVEKLIAHKDIICYKHIKEQYYAGEKFLVTPYQKSIIEIGSTFKSKLEKSHITPTISIGLHSFKYKEDCLVDAKSESLTFRNIGNNDYFVCKCIIPEGSEYYKGTFMGSECYASSQIKYLKMIEKIPYRMKPIKI